MRSVMLAVVMLGMAGVVQAQTPVIPGDRVAWDQVATNLAEAQSFTYETRISATGTPVQAQNVVCTGTVSPFVCRATFPAATPGVQHDLYVRANRSVTVDGKPVTLSSAYSVPFSFRLEVIPGTPVNVRRDGSE